MSDTKIVLDPDLFMALGLSAEANGGIGPGPFYDLEGTPCCVHGHAKFLADPINAQEYRNKLYEAGLSAFQHDNLLRDAGVSWMRRIPFGQWCETIGVDVAA